MVCQSHSTGLEENELKTVSLSLDNLEVTEPPISLNYHACFSITKHYAASLGHLLHEQEKAVDGL